MTQSDASCLALPADLLAAEEAMLQAALAAVGSGDGQRWAASLRFEGLRLLPVAVRLARALIAAGQDLLMVWPDAGAAALARRDAEDLKEVILDFNQLKRADSDALDTRWGRRCDPACSCTPDCRQCRSATHAADIR